MDTASPRFALITRWALALSLGLVCLFLIRGILGSPGVDPGVVHVLTLTAVALVVYAWMTYAASWNLLISLIMFVAVAWAWAARRSPMLGADLATLAVLVGAAAWQRRVRGRRSQRLDQVLGDLGEERRVKEQAVGLAQRAREALQRKHARYSQLQSIAEQLSNMTQLDEIARLAVESTFTLIGKSDTCLLFLVDHEQQVLSLFASKKREHLAVIRAKHGDQFDRYVLRSQRPLLVNDVRRDFRFTVSLASDRAISSVIACPLMVGQSAEGVLRLDSGQTGCYSQDDLRFLDILLDLVSTAITNAQLFARMQQLAMTDGLTGLSLRRPFLEQLARELVRAGRGDEPASVLMVDVDHFKKYNDAYGHTAGDVILKSVADALRAVVPPEGVSARYGGEEFAVLLPHLGRAQAAELADRIREMVASHVTGGGSPKPVTVSIGVASFPDDAKDDLALIRVADDRLYRAKRGGRNTVCHS